MSFWALPNAGFSATLILSFLGLVTVILFSHWRVGKHCGHHQMSHSQQPLSKAAAVHGVLSCGKQTPPSPFWV